MRDTLKMAFSWALLLGIPFIVVGAYYQFVPKTWLEFVKTYPALIGVYVFIAIFAMIFIVSILIKWMDKD